MLSERTRRLAQTDSQRTCCRGLFELECNVR